ncbi:MAG: EpsI family protein [Geobacteraceae bacterium]|nr:EpsI family protein [Geobacteraceae bacterium]
MTFSETIQRYRLHLLGIILLLLCVYFSVLKGMVLQWYSDDNYSHGFLVPIISGYFLYDRRAAYKNTVVSPWRPGLAVIIFGLLQFILGYLATENFTMRLSFIVLLAGLVLYLFGRELFRQLLLPLGYLIMMVPLPYILYNMVAFPLKLFITRCSVALLQLFGIVVLREGNIIMFPATTLEVADACSGMRSIMSLLAMGIAIAFFIRMTPTKRTMLISFSIPVAIFTNMLRVVITGVLVHNFGAQVAEGLVHELSGLLVFVVAMAILVWIGSLLESEDNVSVPMEPSAVTSSYRVDHLSLRCFVIVAALLLLTAGYKGVHADVMIPLNQPFSAFPRAHAEWIMTAEETFNAATLELLKPTDYLSRTYRDASGVKVKLYIGYHGGGEGTGEIHSPRHCLPGSGWQEVSSTRTILDSHGERINLVKASYMQGDRIENIFYWFQVRNSSLSSEFALKIAEFTGSMLHRRRDAAFIRVSFPAADGTTGSFEAGDRFIKEFYPVIRGFIPQ